MKPLRGSATKIGQKKATLASLRKENRALKSRNRELTASRASWKAKCRLSPSTCRQQQKRCFCCCLQVASRQPIERHKYDEQMVSLCVNIYVSGGCGLRGVVKIVEYLNVALLWGLEEIPCKSSVENWVVKAGYYIYDEVDTAKYEQGYAIILDECMVQGQERMLAVLGVPADKGTEHALKLTEVDVLSLQVRPSWNAENIAKVMEEIAQKIGSKPTYIISDGNTNLKSAIGKYGSIRICDVGHEIARLLEQTYRKQPAFEAFMQACIQCKRTEVMKPTSYLTPPKQRIIARFMNLSHTFTWARKLLKVHRTLPAPERKAFSFIKKHTAIIDELHDAFEMINDILQVLKNLGLSFKTVKKCLKKCRQYLLTAPHLLREFIAKVKAYLQTEKQKLPTKDTVWHICSDILESMFGMFKNKKAANPLHGVTPFALYLPVLTTISTEEPGINCSLKDALEAVRMSDLKTWNKNHLIENQVVKRGKILNKKD